MANLLSPTTISLLILITFSYDALSNDEDSQLDSVCYFFCDNSTSNISEVYLNKQQIQHLKGCKQFINALEDTPEMMNTYQDLRAMEMVKFTDEQVKQLLVGNRGYFHQRSHLPREQQVNDIKPESNYSSDELQALEEEFLERWLAYREIEDSLKSYSVHFPLGKSSSSSSQSSSWSSQSSSPSSQSSRRRRRRLVKSYRPHQSRPGMERKLVRKKGGMASQDPKINLTHKTKDFFRSNVGRRRTNPFLRKESSSINYDESSADSFQERLYQRYLQALETSVEKMTEMSRNRRNVDRQKREDPKPAESLELCPTSKFWTAMVLGYDESGNLVQVTQFPEYGQQQWFQEEKCLYALSPAQGNVECRIRFREVPAMVVDLQDPNAPVQESFIKVESCAAYLITADEVAGPTEEVNGTSVAPTTPPPAGSR